MRFHRITKTTRRWVFPLTGWLSAVLYLIVASGLPISLPGKSGKDLSVPFPCMDSPCGCQNAEQCWRSCCCTTLEQRIDWARKNHIKPPDFAIADARAKGINVDDFTGEHTCSDEKHDCCDDGPESMCCCCSHASQPQASNADNSIVLIRALQCSGVGYDWTSVGVAVIVPPISCEFQLIPCGWIQPASIIFSSVARLPDVPPPRYTVA